ncbi:glycosyltransferase family 39 protein [bacterium]|nr:glycosyltransferase family 39 protein [bacterium]
MRIGVAIAFGLVALSIVYLSIDEPGLTIDEPINTGHGKRMVYALTHDVARESPAVWIDGLFRSGHEHPPLARFLIGLAHASVDPAPNDADVIVPFGGRPASAIAFGVVVGLAAWEAGRWAGLAGSIWAGLFTLLLPRLLGHAYFASPEVISTAFMLASLIACRIAMEPSPRWTARVLAYVVAGFAIGLAMLTKLTAVVVPITFLISLLLTHGLRSLGPLLLTGSISMVTLVGGWPWLWPVDLPGYSAGWLGTGERLVEFFRVGLDRATIYVDYLGTQYPHDGLNVPWHFVWFFFVFTLPVSTLLLGAIGWGEMFVHRRTSPSAVVWIIMPILSLSLFTLPIDRYDSERLFLFIFPVISLLAGTAVKCAGRSRIALTILWLIGSVGMAWTLRSLVLLHPLPLSYFNELLGGLRGAERCQVELTYWGDTVTPAFLDGWASQADEGDHAILIPTLYQGHPHAMMTPAMQKRNLRIIPPPPVGTGGAPWAIVFRREGYLHDKIAKEVMQKGTLVAEQTREGVWLTRLYRLPAEH